MDIQSIASIIGGLVFTFLVSREESKPEDKRNKKYSKYGRPVLNEILKTKGINLSDSYIKELHKTMINVGKSRGVNEFHKNVTPKIERILTRGLNELNSNTSDDYKTKLAKSIVRDFVKIEDKNSFKTQRVKSKNRSRTLQKKDTGVILQLTKKKPKGILKLPDPKSKSSRLSSGLSSVSLPKGNFGKLKNSLESRKRKRSRSRS